MQAVHGDLNQWCTKCFSWFLQLGLPLESPYSSGTLLAYRVDPPPCSETCIEHHFAPSRIEKRPHVQTFLGHARMTAVHPNGQNVFVKTTAGHSYFLAFFFGGPEAGPAARTGCRLGCGLAFGLAAVGGCRVLQELVGT